jgi:hypothetical protein
LFPKEVSTLPDSENLFSPRWSPDGRYIVGRPSDSRSLMLFDFATQKWQEIAKTTNGFPLVEKWRVCLLPARREPAIGNADTHSYRRIERVADLKNFRQTGFFNV